jgi:Ras family protein T1
MTYIVDSSALTLQQWLAQWSMTTLLDHRTTIAYLGYLGYSDEPRTDALQITRPRKVDRRKGKTSRNVFLCYVCGAAGSGKTALLRAFADQRPRDAYEPTSKVVSVVNAVDLDGAEKYLVLQEFGSKYEAETLRNSKKTDLADVIIYVYDSSDTNSFSYISNLRVCTASPLPRCPWLTTRYSNSTAWITCRHSSWPRSPTSILPSNDTRCNRTSTVDV